MICRCGNAMSSSAKTCRACDIVRRKNERGTIGMAGTSIYNRWYLMLRRCNNPRDPRYHQYGGRGIKVCERWHRFENYYADMGNVPFKGAEIDRIDPDGNYEPGNCRWVNRKDNMKNTRWSSENRNKYRMICLDRLCNTCRDNVVSNRR